MKSAKGQMALVNVKSVLTFVELKMAEQAPQIASTSPIMSVVSIRITT